MTTFCNFYFQCPNCNATLQGKKLRPTAVKSNVLYSDGKMITNGLLSEKQQVVRCPSCAFIFWLSPNCIPVSDAETNNYISSQTDDMSMAAYAYSTWYQFGCNPFKTEGIKALINHYLNLLIELKPFSAEQEIYLRQQLLWACNDLVRYNAVNKIKSLFVNLFYFMGWHNCRIEAIKRHIMFLKLKPVYVFNLKRLIELMRSSKEKPMEKELLAELYREKGNFIKAKETLQQINQSSHYVANIRKNVHDKNSIVFKVAG